MRSPTPEVALKYQVYRFEFRAKVSLRDIEETLLLALTAAEGVHGEARVRLEGGFRLCREHRDLAIDASGEVGRDLARVFTHLLSRQFGEEAFTVARVARAPMSPPDAPQPVGAGR
jgi:hypothetical protein